MRLTKEILQTCWGLWDFCMSICRAQVQKRRRCLLTWQTVFHDDRKRCTSDIGMSLYGHIYCPSFTKEVPDSHFWQKHFTLPGYLKAGAEATFMHQSVVSLHTENFSFQGQKGIQTAQILPQDHLPSRKRTKENFAREIWNQLGALANRQDTDFSCCISCVLSVSIPPGLPVTYIAIDTFSFHFSVSAQLCQQKNGFCHLSRSASATREQCHWLSLI